jgi:quercetin dioxygenase-like cupin family protein
MEATVENLVESIDYQDGAVVSRTLVKKSTGNVTLFAFDQGEGLSEHTTPFDALVQVLDGQAQITIGGVGYELSAGEAVVMPADIPHALKAEVRFKMMLTMIRSKE